MENTAECIEKLSQVERLAEEILRDRSEIVALDRRRNETREGLRSLTKMSSKETWITIGPSLIRLPTEKAKTLLDKDQKETNVEINKLQSDLKEKVNKLREMEYQEPIAGFSLKPLNNKELSALGQAFGEHA